MKKIARIAAAAAICIFNTMEAKDAMETLTPKEKALPLAPPTPQGAAKKDWKLRTPTGWARG